MKKRDEKNPGGIIDVPKPIRLSKLALICPACHKPTRVGFLTVKNDKYRICRNAYGRSDENQREVFKSLY